MTSNSSGLDCGSERGHSRTSSRLLLTGIRYAPLAALLEIVADQRDSSDSNNRRQRLQLGAQLDVFIAALTRWRLAHIGAVRRFIGDGRGSGGTAGLGYLIDRLFEASLPS